MLHKWLQKVAKVVLKDELHILETNIEIAECEAALHYDIAKTKRIEAHYMKQEIEALNSQIETLKKNSTVSEEDMIDVFLDDDVENRDPKKIYGSSNWLIARTIETVIPLLRKGVVRNLSLDHDLGYEKTGYDLLSWIEENNYWPSGTIYLHTRNIVGKQRMQQILDNRERSQIVHKRLR